MCSATKINKIPVGFYPERKKKRGTVWDNFLHDYPGYFLGKILNRSQRFHNIVDQVSFLGRGYKEYSDAQLSSEISVLRVAMARGGINFDRVAKSFALVREQAGRILGMTHHDVQLVGGLVMFGGMIAEMETGEGKSLTATLPACTAALSGMPVHVITVNDYLAERDAALFAPLYEAMGLTVGVISHGMDSASRRAAYGCDIVYCSNKEIVFDYLKDRLNFRPHLGHIAYPLQRLYGNKDKFARLHLRGLYFAIVDEADSVFIDEARTPLVISGQGDNSLESDACRRAMTLARQLIAGNDFLADAERKQVTFTDAGARHLAELVEDDTGFWVPRQRREDLIGQALAALHFFSRDKDYIVEEGRVVIVDEYTGRTMADRAWENGLHQMLECKEGCEITPRKETLARISYQRFFRRYHLLAGMTGTAREVARELWSVYGLPVVSVPTNVPLQRNAAPPRFFQSESDKMQAVVARLAKLQRQGRPVLVGTRTVEASERLSSLLAQAGLPHRVLNARQDKEEAEIIACAGESGQITIATNMAGRGTDIKLGHGVRELGGLQVIVTERHSAARIDRQLFGRCGRQGDPGSYAEFLCVEDDLVSGRHLLRCCSRLSAKGKGGEFSAMGRLWCRLVFKLAQRACEKKHFLIRRSLLKADEEMEATLAFSGERE